MQGRIPLPLKVVLPSVIVWMALHAASLAAFPSFRVALSYGFELSLVALACGICVWQSRNASGEVRLHWLLFSSALFLWGCGMARAGWEEIFLRLDPSQTSYADFPYFLYGVPVVLGISLPAREDRVALFFWLDTAQVTASALLTYLVIFTTLPFLDRPVIAVSTGLLARAYCSENIVLALGASLRLFSAPNGETRFFFRILNIFLWCYAVASLLNNWVSLRQDGVMGYSTLLVDVPFVVLLIALAWPRTGKAEAPMEPSGILAPLIQNASPVFFTLAMIGLSLAVMRDHFYLGAIGVVLAALIYCLRVTLLQIRLMQSQRGLQEARDQLEALSLTDALTGLPNRRSFDLMLEREWRRSARTQEPLGVLMIDIDCFKKLNDRYGHTRGDECLRLVGATLQQSLLRSTDLVARYGGEEFSVLLPGTDDAGALETAERLRHNVAALQFANGDAETGYVTLSIGIALLHPRQAFAKDRLVQAADEALYRAKQAGRNRVDSSALTFREA